jgi:hypothetical protein
MYNLCSQVVSFLNEIQISVKIVVLKNFVFHNRPLSLFLFVFMNIKKIHVLKTGRTKVTIYVHLSI